MTFGRFQHRPAKQIDYTPRPRAPALPVLAAIERLLSAQMAAPVAKFEYVRSPALLKACRQIACQNCRREDGTVVAAHSNWAQHGKGKSIKASDVFVAALCFTCHSMLDQGSTLSREQRQELWTAAWVKTVAELVRRGLWPQGVPIPDTSQVSQPQAPA